MAEREHLAKTTLLMTCRLVGGGAFIVAAAMKLRDVPALMLSIESFELLPAALIPFVAYTVPWVEIASGLALIYGFWSRSAAALAGVTYLVFTGALASVLLRGMEVDCGCFGALTGGGPVTWLSVVRNLVFFAACAAVMACGGGTASLDCSLESRVPESRLDRFERRPGTDPASAAAEPAS